MRTLVSSSSSPPSLAFLALIGDVDGARLLDDMMLKVTPGAGATAAVAVVDDTDCIA